jgi:hypothetical protein
MNRRKTAARPTAQLARILSWAILACFAAAESVQAGTGSRVSLPAGKAKSGLKINVDSSWVDANGYRPIHFEFIPWPATPAPADRSIRVEIMPASWRGGFANCGVVDYVEIAQGAVRVETTISVPQREQWSNFTIEFYEDGKHLEDLTGFGSMGNVAGYGWTEASPAMLFIDRDAPARSLRQSHIATLRQAGSQGDSRTLPDVRGLAEIYPPHDLQRVGYNPDERAADLTILDGLSGWSKIEILPAADLSVKWIDYTGLDLVFISLDDLRDMTGNHGPQWQAVRDSIATGSTLCVYGVGDVFARLEELEQLLELPPLDNAGQDAHRGWSVPAKSDFTRQLTNTQPIYNQYYAQTAEAVDPNTEKALNQGEGKPPQNPNFVWRGLDLGHVVAIGTEDPFPGRPQEWGWLLNSVDSRDWMWHRRHGLSLNRRNLDYWSFLIPGVGLAPVNTFLVLISLFVVLIGPVNYWFLVRQGRLYLLLVTVPLGAFLVTMSLFGYALMTDGLGVKARIRSYTEIDQRRGQSVSWSRQSYYAGMAPSRGLQYPETAAVYPIEVQPGEKFNYNRPEREIDWEEGQTLLRGYIAPRITSQLMVVQARETKAQIQIQEPASGAPAATNHLGVDVEYLVIRDSQGNFYAAQDFAEGATSTLAPIAWADASRRLQETLAAARPANPKGYDPREHNEVLNFGTSQYSYWGGDVDSSLDEPTVTSSILERSLRRVTSSDPDALSPRSYVALVPQSPEVPFGVERMKQMKSVHVVEGKW